MDHLILATRKRTSRFVDFAVTADRREIIERRLKTRYVLRPSWETERNMENESNGESNCNYVRSV